MAQDPSTLSDEQLKALRSRLANQAPAPQPSGPSPLSSMGTDALVAAHADAMEAGLGPNDPIMAAIEAAPAPEPYRGQSGNPIDITDWDAESLMQLPQGAWVVHRKYENGQPFQLAAAPETGFSPGGENVGNAVVTPPMRWDQDIIRSGMTGAIEGITGLVGLPGTVQEAVANATGMPRDFGDPFGRGYASARDLDTLTQDVIGDYYQPQTTAGEYARTIGQNLPNAVVPGGIATRVASVAVPALASETAGQFTEGTPFEPWARAGGAVLGAGAVGGVSAMRNGVGRTLQNAAEGVTPEQLQMAAALRERGAALGTPLTNAEAVQQVTNGATGLARVQRVIEGVNPRIGQMMAERPAQTQTAIGRVLEQIAPAAEPQAVAGNAQRAATGVLDTMRDRVNESARPFYDRLQDQVVAADEYKALRSLPTYRAAEAAYMGNPELQTSMVRGPQNMDTVNRVIQQMDQLATAEAPTAVAPGNRTLSSSREQAAQLAKMIGDYASPDYATARLTGATGRQAFVEPLERGPIGRIASQNEAMPGLQGQANAMFPNAPYEGQARETAQALRLLNEVDPSVPPSLVRQHLAQQAAEATQNLQSGPSQFGGANFAARTFGNPLQRETILNAVDVAAPEASRDVRDLVQVLQATGRREGVGSNTAFNRETMDALREGGLAQGAVAVAANPPGVFGRMARGVEDWAMRRNADRLAELLIGDSEDFASAIRRAASAPRGSNRLRLLASLVQSQNNNREEAR